MRAAVPTLPCRKRVRPVRDRPISVNRCYRFVRRPGKLPETVGKAKPLLRIIRYGSPVSGKAGRMTSAGIRPAELRLRKTGRRSPGGVVRCLPFADDALVFSPVDINIQRGVEPDMPHRLALVDGRHRVEPPFVEQTSKNISFLVRAMHKF